MQGLLTTLLGVMQHRPAIILASLKNKMKGNPPTQLNPTTHLVRIAQPTEFYPRLGLGLGLARLYVGGYLFEAPTFA